MNDIPGARWWKFDFHTHTPASTDYGSGPNQSALQQMTPGEWLESFLNAGIECVAVTDHHTGDWIDQLKTELDEMVDGNIEGASNLTLFPGVELSVSGIHYLAIFDPSETTDTIKTLLARVRYDGNSENHQGICEETNVVTVCNEVEKLGGILIPAHVDLDATGLFRHTQTGVLRPIFTCDAILACEVSENGFNFPQIYQDAKVNWTVVTGSDSHHPTPKTDGSGRYPGSHYSWVKMGNPSLSSLRLALQDGNGSGILSSFEVTGDPNQTPEDWLESLEVQNAKLMGRQEPENYRFSPWLNSIIGGRGSGKSTLVHFIRLAGRRENDLDRLHPDSRPRKSFISFVEESGGVLNETEATLIYRKGEEQYRLNWKRSDRGTTVESWEPSVGMWVDEDSQNVRERFPITIFSQEQIATLAESPQAILQRIDEEIDHQAWQSRWQQELESFLRLRSEVRNLKNRSTNKDRLLGQMKDLTKKLEVFEKSEHAQVLKTARRFQRQADEFNSFKDRHLEMSEELKQFAEDFLLYDLSEDLYDPSRPQEAPLAEVEKQLRSSVEMTRDKLLRLAKKLKTTNQDALKAINKSEWKEGRKIAKRSHDQLVENLKSQGVENPDEYAGLLQQRQGIAKELSKVKALEEEIKQKEIQAASSLKNLAELRKELTMARERFLQENIADNAYVRISVVPLGRFSDREEAEQSLRQVLGCEDGRYKQSILSEDGNDGLIAGLYQESNHEGEDERTQEKEEQLEQLKESIAAHLNERATDSSFTKPFVKFLRDKAENNPEVFDRLAAWWPEDSLEVRYSKTGDGRNFSSLEDGSAGEKAAALLAFFLAYGESPLVIDQPENDLDNHLITDLVVKQLQENKSRRQIIVVSHNPNIVVNADSEMVHAMKYVRGQCRPIAQGALQEETVRNEVCEVMEGGELALRKRYRRLTTPQ